MADSGRLDELKRKFDENPRRYFAPLANEYRKTGELDRAIELCRTYLPQQPTHMSGYIVYGQSLLDGGRGQEAAAAFKQALTLDPENVIALRYLGDIAREGGDPAGAMCWYGKVLELDPRNDEIAGFITTLATPSQRSAPRNERSAPPTVRPEPVFDSSAVGLDQLIAEPDQPQPEIARQPERDQEDARAPESDQVAAHGNANQHEPLVLLEQSFEIISWPKQPSHEETAAARSCTDLPEMKEPVLDQNSERRAEAEHDSQSEAEARTFADLLPEEPTPVAPTGDTFLDMTSVLRRSVGPDVPGAAANGATDVDDSPFITETLAELYVQQGLTHDALVIYRQLAVRRADPRLAQRIADLESASAQQNAQGGQPSEAATNGASASDNAARSVEPPVVRETVREFFARLGVIQPRSHAHIAADNATGLASIFKDATPDAGDLAAAQSLAGAFGSSGRAAADSGR